MFDGLGPKDFKKFTRPKRKTNEQKVIELGTKEAKSFGSARVKEAAVDSNGMFSPSGTSGTEQQRITERDEFTPQFENQDPNQSKYGFRNTTKKQVVFTGSSREHQDNRIQEFQSEEEQTE